MFRIVKTLAMASAAVALLAAQTFAQDTPAAKIKVVATFSILGDFVRQVGGDRVELTTLVGPNGDAHVYQPSPADARKVAEAKLVVMNGIGFEGWFERFITASGAKPRIAIASSNVKALAAGIDDGEKAAGKKPDATAGHSHGAFDPHAWQNVANAKAYVIEIKNGLEAADPAGTATYEANATAYLAQLDALDSEVRAGVAAIPPGRRRIITTHDAFGYFGKAYGMVFIAPQGVSTESEASAKDVAKIIRQIRAEKIPAVFLENISDDRMMQRIAAETGAKIGGKVFSDALSPPDGPAATYVDMMRNNIREFRGALAGT